MDIAAELCGPPCKAEKSVTGASELIVLGTSVAVVMASASVSIKVDPGKATRWSAILRRILATGICEQTLAVKLAGRLSFAVTASVGK